MKNYDVFISCKSEDYKFAEELYVYLSEHGFNVFLSSKELRRLQDAEYMDAISEAIESAYHLIILSSSKENVVSKWVKFEWTTFLNEILSGRKEGQILTLLHNMTVSTLPIQLRHYESFTMEDYNDRILSYVETPAYVERKEQERQKALKEAERLRKEQEEEQHRESIKQQVEDSVGEYQRFAANLELRAQQIIEKLELIGVVEKKCPICDTSVALNSKFCKKCGWTFIPEFDAHPTGNHDHIFLMQSNWRAANKECGVSKNDFDKLQKQLVSEQCQNHALHEHIKDLSDKLKCQQTQHASLDKKCQTIEAELVKSRQRTKLLESVEARNRQLEKEKEQFRLESISKEYRINTECDKLRKENESIHSKLSELEHQIDVLRQQKSELKLKVEKNNCSEQITAPVRLRIDKSGTKKLMVVKLLTDLCGLKLIDAKSIADKTPSILPGGYTRPIANFILGELADAGAMVSSAENNQNWKIYNPIYVITLLSVGSNRLEVCKQIKEFCHLGLAEVKHVIESVPIRLPGTYTYSDAQNIRAMLQQLGAIAIIDELK